MLITRTYNAFNELLIELYATDRGFTIKETCNEKSTESHYDTLEEALRGFK